MALDIAEELHFSVDEMSFIGSATLLGFGLIQLPSGLLTDRLGGKKTLLLLTLLAGTSTVWFSMAESLGSITVSRLFTGIGVSATIPCTAMLARRFSPEVFARVCNAMYGLGALGTIAAAAPLAMASTWLGWRNSMFLCGIFSLVLATLLLLFVHETQAKHVSSRQRQNLFCNIKNVVSHRHFWLLCTVYSGVMIAFFGFYGLWFGPYLVQACGLSKIEAGTVQSIGAMASIAGMPVAAVLSDMVQSRKKIIVSMCCVSTLCICLLAIFSGRLPVPCLILLAALFTFCNGSAGLCFTSCKELFPIAIIGTAAGCLNTLQPLLGAASQKLFGMLLVFCQSKGLDIAEAYGFSLLLYVTVLIRASAASFFIRETHPSVYQAKE